MMLRNPGLRYIAAATAVIILAGLSVFMVGSYALSEDAATEAQASPDTTPAVVESDPHPEVAAMITAVAQEQTREPFAGEANGATFLQPGEPIPQSEECPNDRLVALSGDEARARLARSDASFEVTERPAGLTPDRVSVALCNDEVVSVQKVFIDNDNLEVYVIWKRFPAVYPALASEDRLEAREIAGRQAVLVKPIQEGLLNTIIVMQGEDGESHWLINGRLSVEDAIKVAEGLEVINFTYQERNFWPR